MFDPNSRYFDLATKTITTEQGKEIAYKSRRFLPGIETLTLSGEVVVRDGERLDHIATKVLNDPLRFWQIADANTTLNPLQLTQQPGRTLNIAMIKR